MVTIGLVWQLIENSSNFDIVINDSDCHCWSDITLFTLDKLNAYGTGPSCSKGG